MEQKCEDAVEKHADFIVDAIIKNLSAKEICTVLGFCIGEEVSSSHAIETLELKNDTPQCVICEFVVMHLETEMWHKKTQAKIRQDMLNICTSLPKHVSTNCKQFVNKYADLIIKLVSTMPPKEICAEINLCVTNQHIDEEVSSRHAMETLPPALEARYADTPQCVLCELVMTRLETELKNKKTQDEIRTTVLNICSKLPKTVTTSCKQFVNQYADLIISLVSTVPPKEICGEINLCLTHQTKDLAIG